MTYSAVRGELNTNDQPAAGTEFNEMCTSDYKRAANVKRQRNRSTNLPLLSSNHMHGKDI